MGTLTLDGEVVSAPRSRTYTVFVLATIVAVLVFTVTCGNGACIAGFDQCYAYTVRAVMGLSDRTVAHMVVVSGLLTLLAYVCVPHVSLRSVFLSACMVMWGENAYLFCNFLKTMLGDHLCSRRANSVSGHYNWYLFFMLSTLWLVVGRARDPFVLYNYLNKRVVSRFLRLRMRRSAYVQIMCLGTYVVLTVICLTRTYLGGYHTPRQILYGLLLALISHLLFILTIRDGNRTTRYQVVFVVSTLFCYLVGVYFSQTGVDVVDIVLSGVCGLIIFVYPHIRHYQNHEL